MKLYKCEFPNCEKEVVLRTTIKDKESEYYGLRVCSTHGSMLRKKTISDKTKRTQKARQEQRKDYPEFYQTMIDLSIGKNCAECGKRLNGNVSEIAHIFKKTTDGGNPELATESENILFLCGVFSENQCHSKFDSSLAIRKKMKVFPIVLERFKILKNKIKNLNSSEVIQCIENLI